MEGILPAQISPFDFSLFIATECVIFKSSCSTLHFALQSYPSSLFTAERQ